MKPQTKTAYFPSADVCRWRLFQRRCKREVTLTPSHVLLISGLSLSLLEHGKEQFLRNIFKVRQVRLKKYFYVLRPLLAVSWMEQGRGQVPVEFDVLLDCLQDDEVKEEIVTLENEKYRSAMIGIFINNGGSVQESNLPTTSLPYIGFEDHFSCLL